MISRQHSRPRRHSSQPYRAVFGLILALIALWPGLVRSDVEWVSGSGSGEARVHLYFFWSQSCPHCRNARPFVERLENELSWLELHSYELTSSRDNVARYVEMVHVTGLVTNCPQRAVRKRQTGWFGNVNADDIELD